MKVVLACDSFKGSLDALSAVNAVKRGITRVFPEINVVLCPVCDGGEGTVKILTTAAHGNLLTATVHGPLMDLVTAQWGLLDDNQTAILEVAQVAGLTLLQADQRDPTRTTSYGLGELITNAMDAGAKRFIIGLGGSATNDGGTGMAEALGVRFLGTASPMNGGALTDITSIDLSHLDKRIEGMSFQVAVDVSNPLLGPHGAASVFSPQKGATPKQVTLLEKGMRNLASFLPQVSPDLTGAGGAGGLGWGLVAFLNAELKSGIDLCLDTLNFETLLDGADLVITGEGSFDRQTLFGKVPIGVAQRAAAMHIPTIILSGSHDISSTDLERYGIVGCYSICKDLDVSVEQSIAEAPVLLEDLAAKVIPKYATVRVDFNY
jgi:glycerate 2-kinase